LTGNVNLFYPGLATGCEVSRTLFDNEHLANVISMSLWVAG